MPRHTPTDLEPASRRWPVRLILIAIVFALVLPGLVFCGILINRLATAERTRSQETAQAAALRGAETLDRELGNLGAALLALSTSHALTTGDLAAFHEQASTLADSLGQVVVLSDPAGQQLVNTSRPAGAVLPAMVSMDTLRKVVATRQPAVTDLFIGGTSAQPTVAVEHPVLRHGRVAYVLVMSLKPAFISALLERQGLPKGWVTSVIDGSHRVVARNADAARFIGQMVSQEVIDHTASERTMWVGTSLDGRAVLAAMQPLHFANWRVAVGVPLSIVEAPLRSTLMLLAITGAITLAIAGLLALQLGRSVTTPLRRLARAGTALSQGLPVLGVRSSIAEVDAVSDALVRATRDLRARADALAAERAQLAAVIETVPVGIIIAEAPSGRIVAGNSRIETMLRHKMRFSESDADYGEWVAHHADGRRVLAAEHPLALVLHGAAHAELQCIYQRGDGTPLWVRFIAAPILAADGTITGGVAAALDIDEVVRAREAKARFAESLETEVADRTNELKTANQRLRDEIDARATAEEQLRQAQKMEAVGQLTGGIAHDFNNLLTIVIGSLDLLRRRAEDDRSRRLLDNALEGATRAATLTARLLAFSRRQPLSPQAVDLNRLIAGMSDLLHRTLGDGVQVETVLAGGVWPTLADPNQLENALLNLAVNARDAIATSGRPEGRLTIETANAVLDEAFAAQEPELQAGDYVRVSVTDTGTGMPADVVARVFEPFFTTKPQGQGTGLGLSQVHGFVKQSGGHVTIRTAPDEGTTVTIYLPRGAGPEPEIVAGDQGVTAEPKPSGLTVLVVEDDGGVRRYSVEALRELGHVVLEADGAPAALRLLDAHPEVGLLLTDVVLPGMDGVRLAAAVRERRPDLPVLFASGFADAESCGEGPLPVGGLLLQKPFTVQELAEKLAVLLG